MTPLHLYTCAYVAEGSGFVGEGCTMKNCSSNLTKEKKGQEKPRALREGSRDHAFM